jgi:hypothetical protein
MNHRISFETRQKLTRGQRRIRNKTARAMATWSHYRFKWRLLNKAREYPWCRIIIRDEHYKSKKCGFLHDKLGSSKIFQCSQCQFTLDRDINVPGVYSFATSHFTPLTDKSNNLVELRTVFLVHSVNKCKACMSIDRFL